MCDVWVTFDSTMKPASAVADSLLFTAADIGARGFLKPLADVESFCAFCTLAHRSMSYTREHSETSRVLCTAATTATRSQAVARIADHTATQ